MYKLEYNYVYIYAKIYLHITYDLHYRISQTPYNLYI